MYLFIEGIHIINSSTSTSWRWRRPQLIKSFTNQKYAGSSWPSKKLVGSEENCIIAIDLPWSQVDFHIRTAIISWNFKSIRSTSNYNARTEAKMIQSALKFCLPCSKIKACKASILVKKSCNWSCIWINSSDITTSRNRTNMGLLAALYKSSCDLRVSISNKPLSSRPISTTSAKLCLHESRFKWCWQGP